MDHLEVENWIGVGLTLGPQLLGSVNDHYSLGYTLIECICLKEGYNIEQRVSTLRSMSVTLQPMGHHIY